ncbi:hypothetical protein BvCmsHHP019_04250 [Escherichia coli]|nr:hypothetical protein BvCmsHHP019_04250 [Escherichia coli]
MKLTGADEQIAAYCFKMPFVFHLIEEVSRNFGYALCLINIDHKAALNITQRTAANILLDGQMQHAVDQAFTQRTARQGHTLNIQFGKNGDQDRQTTREH